MVTDALGTTAPEGSLTVPDTFAVIACEKAGRDAIRARTAGLYIPMVYVRPASAQYQQEITEAGDRLAALSRTLQKINLQEPGDFATITMAFHLARSTNQTNGVQQH